MMENQLNSTVHELERKIVEGPAPPDIVWLLLSERLSGTQTK